MASSQKWFHRPRARKKTSLMAKHRVAWVHFKHVQRFIGTCLRSPLDDAATFSACVEAAVGLCVGLVGGWIDG